MTIAIPQIDIPHIVHGDNGSGVGRGPGKPGDVIDKGKGKGKGGSGAGEGHQEGILISLDMEDVLKIMEQDLELPPMKPKPTQTFEDIKVIYNNIAKMGPESLRHTRRTILEAVKRMAASNDLNKMHLLPGNKVPTKLIVPENQDKRYKQYREVKIPSSNAVILFARDCSGSMDQFKCDVINDMCWWIDIWIRKYYEKVERVYLIHDDEAEEVSEKKFYKYRDGGGTKCSSVFKLTEELLENRFPTKSYNIYIFYFTDGDNWSDDNEALIKSLQVFNPNDVNLVGITQIMSYSDANSVKGTIETAIKEKILNGDNIRTASIGNKSDGKKIAVNPFMGYGGGSLTEDDRNQQILDAIKAILGKDRASVAGEE